MKVPDYSLVVAVDAEHLEQLRYTWPTWRKHKPSLLRQPMIVFYDVEQVVAEQVRGVIDHPNLRVEAWPPGGTVWQDKPEYGRFGSAQRQKMLAGFVHVPAATVQTPYWLKLDTDAVAVGMDDWVDAGWFAGTETMPAVIGPPWGYTKPAVLLELLDAWAEKVPQLARYRPLDLRAEPGQECLNHRRVAGWCVFYRTDFTRWCATWAREVEERPYHLPVPSQDTYMWYVATRLGYPVVRENMKRRGWQLWHTMDNIRRSAREALLNG